MWCFLICPHPFSWTPLFALLCPSVIPPLVVVSTVFSFVFVPFCVFYLSRAAELSGNPVESLSFWLLFYCLSCGPFFDSTFARLDTLSSDTFFLADVESQCLPLSHSVKDRGHKSSTLFLKKKKPTALYMWKQMLVSLLIFYSFQSQTLPSIALCGCFSDPWPAPPSTAIIINQTSPSCISTLYFNRTNRIPHSSNL